MNNKDTQKKEIIKENLRENFITNLHLENLNEDETNRLLEIATEFNFLLNRFSNPIGESGVNGFLLSSIGIENLYLLKAINANNKKLDTLIEQNKSLIELLSKDK